MMEQEPTSLVRWATTVGGVAEETELEVEEGRESWTNLTESLPVMGTSIPTKHDRLPIVLAKHTKSRINQFLILLLGFIVKKTRKRKWLQETGGFATGVYSEAPEEGKLGEN